MICEVEVLAEDDETNPEVRMGFPPNLFISQGFFVRGIRASWPVLTLIPCRLQPEARGVTTGIHMHASLHLSRPRCLPVEGDTQACPCLEFLHCPVAVSPW